MARRRVKALQAKTRMTRRGRKTVRPTRRPATHNLSASELALAAFAHDVRTPLTGILAISELLATSELDERERRWVATLRSTAEHLAALTSLVVDAARTQAKGLVLRHETFDPRALVESAAQLLAARASAKGLASKVEIAELPQHVTGDALRLRTILENLLDNAVKFTEHGTVTLQVTATPARRDRLKLAFVVTDSGIGISPAEIKRLFRPFEQASVGVAQRFGGAGLGLAFIKRLARAMGGDLAIESKAGRGSSFRLSVVVEKADAPADGDEIAAPFDQASRPAKPLHVLCVEDNPYGRVVMNTILTQLGHRADFLGDGEAAVAAVTRGTYDLVLMDIKLSGLDGLDVTRRIRSLSGEIAGVPIIGVSGHTALSDEKAARAAGMDGFLAKPVSPGALTEAIAKSMQLRSR
jgi:two-component system, sensor histidine kinase